MASASTTPDAREVDRVEALVTVNDADQVDAFLAACVVGSRWRLQIRTARVTATVLARHPLGTFDERICICLRFGLELPVPVEPGLRFQVLDLEDEKQVATALVRPWQ